MVVVERYTAALIWCGKVGNASCVTRAYSLLSYHIASSLLPPHPLSGSPSSSSIQDVVELPMNNYPSYSYFGHLAALHGLRYWVVPELATDYWANVTVDGRGVEALSNVMRSIARSNVRSHRSLHRRTHEV